MWLAILATCFAGPFSRKTMHEDWPDRQVDRPLVLPKGWMEAEIAWDRKSTRDFRDEDGDRVRYGRGSTWTYERISLNLRQGFSRRTTLYLKIPWVFARLHNELGTETATRALGDVHGGVLWEPWRDGLGIGNHLGLRLDLKAPSGVEWPGNFAGGPGGTSSFLTGTGTTNLGFHVEYSTHIGGPFGLQAHAGYTFRLPSVVGYVIEVDGFGNGWLDPGDEAVVDVTGIVQLSDELAFLASAWYSHRGLYKIGTSGESPFRTVLYPMENTVGNFADLEFGLSYEPDPQIELGFDVRTNVFGSDTRTFAHLGLEEFSPQPGTTLGASGTLRW